jgi:hypothetical protein
MDKHINTALVFAGKSMARDHKHGAVCVIGGKAVCGGFNYPTGPYYLKAGEEFGPV